MQCYVHYVPGRLRLRSPVIKERPGKANAVKEVMEGFDGIQAVSANSVTGSIVVYYDPSLFKPEAILYILKVNGLYDGSRAVTNDDCIQDALTKAGGVIGKALLGWVVGKAFEDAGLGFLAALI